MATNACDGRKGDEAHDQLSSGSQPQVLLCKRDAESLVTELVAFCSSPCLTDPSFASIVERIHGYAAKIRAASNELPDTPPGEPTLMRPVANALRLVRACPLPLKALMIGGIATALMVKRR